jgi:hypothetical protein
MFRPFKDSEDFKTALLTVTQTCGSAHRIIVMDKVKRPSASCRQQKVVIIPSAIHLCLARDMAVFSLRWYFLLVLPLFCFGAVRFFV